jgi:F-box associated protein
MDVWYEIIQRLPIDTINSISLTNKHFNTFCQNPYLWQQIFDFNNIPIKTPQQASMGWIKEYKKIKTMIYMIDELHIKDKLLEFHFPYIYNTDLIKKVFGCYHNFLLNFLLEVPFLAINTITIKTNQMIFHSPDYLTCEISDTTVSNLLLDLFYYYLPFYNNKINHISFIIMDKDKND